MKIERVTEHAKLRFVRRVSKQLNPEKSLRRLWGTSRLATPQEVANHFRDHRSGYEYRVARVCKRGHFLIAAKNGAIITIVKL